RVYFVFFPVIIRFGACGVPVVEDFPLRLAADNTSQLGYVGISQTPYEIQLRHNYNPCRIRYYPIFRKIPCSTSRTPGWRLAEIQKSRQNLIPDSKSPKSSNGPLRSR